MTAPNTQPAQDAGEAEQTPCETCGQPKEPGIYGPLCTCRGIKTYAMSDYPGEVPHLVPSHPANDCSKWYKREDVDPVLDQLKAELESVRSIAAQTEIENRQSKAECQRLREANTGLRTEMAEKLDLQWRAAKAVEAERDAYRDDAESANNYVQTLGVLLGCMDGDDTPQQAIERLRARIGELEGNLKMANDAADKGEQARLCAGGMESEIASLRAQLATAQADTGRLDWLADHPGAVEFVAVKFGWMLPGSGIYEVFDSFRAAIDAALPVPPAPASEQVKGGAQ